MADWLKPMQQTFEYYVVDPVSWKDKTKLNNVLSCTINRDFESETRGSADISIDDSIGEAYVRTYLITIQNGVREKHPLGTHIIQTPSSSFDGMKKSVSMDAYTPLLELKENPTPIGYYIPKKENIMDIAYRLTREHVRAPVGKPSCPDTLFSDFVANTDDTWLVFLSDLISQAKYSYDLDEMGRILFSPVQDIASLQPVWTYNDDNSSILYPDINIEHDMYMVPNAVEVVFSNGRRSYYAKVVNDDPNSPISTVNRGREILHRDTEPVVSNNPTEREIKEYARLSLKNMSTLEYKISYSHGYCPVRPNDCVRLNYIRAGLKNVKARVISQSIKCEPGCEVSETATFTVKLWG